MERVSRENSVEEPLVPTPVRSSDSPPGSVEEEDSRTSGAMEKEKSTRGWKRGRQKKKRNQKKVSATDPDVSLVKWTGMKTKLAYKIYFTVDGH